MDGKQSMDVFDCPISCYHRSKLCTCAFMFDEIRLWLLELDSDGRVDLLGFILCFQRISVMILLRKYAWYFVDC